MPESNEFLSNLAIAIDQTMNVIVALRFAVEAKADVTEELQGATDEALRNLSAMAETLIEAIRGRLNA